MRWENYPINRRGWLVLSGAVGSGLLLASGRSVAQLLPGAAVEPFVVKVIAQKFKYTPNEIILKKGQASVLEFTALDFVHGFHIPDLKIRSDLMPGRVTRVELKIEKEGIYEFLCDNFCGDGHEEMAGKIVVKT